MGIIDIDISSHGHGDTHKGYIDSMMISLGIFEDYDYVDKFTGESYCFDNTCWDEVEMGFYMCMETYGDDDPICEDEYLEILISECSIRCEEEIFVWDGNPVTDIGAFSEMAFPNFYRLSEERCRSFIWDGIWTSEPDKIGCEDSFFIFCNSNSLISAKEVCTTIGKVWTCSFTEAICSES